MDVQWMSFWDIAITIRYSEWSQLSNGYSGDVQVSICMSPTDEMKMFQNII